jgi:Holliday junction resolvase
MNQQQINNNNRLRGKAFERRVVDAFRRAGFDCRRTPFSGSSDVYGKGDVEFLDGNPLFVECKNYKEDLVASTRLLDIINKAYEQSTLRRVIIAIRDTKGHNLLLIEKTEKALIINTTIRTEIVTDCATFLVLPMEYGAKVLACAYVFV